MKKYKKKQSDSLITMSLLLLISEEFKCFIVQAQIFKIEKENASLDLRFLKVEYTKLMIVLLTFIALSCSACCC
jgi:hypothetical protein